MLMMDGAQCVPPKHSLKRTWTTVKSLFMVYRHVAMGVVSFGEANVLDFLLGKFNTFLHSQLIVNCH